MNRKASILPFAKAVTYYRTYEMWHTYMSLACWAYPSSITRSIGSSSSSSHRNTPKNIEIYICNIHNNKSFGMSGRALCVALAHNCEGDTLTSKGRAPVFCADEPVQYSWLIDIGTCECDEVWSKMKNNQNTLDRSHSSPKHDNEKYALAHDPHNGSILFR